MGRTAQNRGYSVLPWMVGGGGDPGPLRNKFDIKTNCDEKLVSGQLIGPWAAPRPWTKVW